MPLSEFTIIEQFFKKLSATNEHIDLGIGDDCALLTVPQGQQLAVSLDVLNESVHFPVGADAELIAARALRVNLSDLAAMGAIPVGFSLGLSLPQVNSGWLEGFSSGLQQTMAKFSCPLIGGDTTKGPLSISIQIYGRLQRGKALKRCGAKCSDHIYLTGTVGDAGFALDVITDHEAGKIRDSGNTRSELNTEQKNYLLSRYFTPEPRISAGQMLLPVAHACIDVSDGLLGDLQHIALASGVKAVVYEERLPFSEALQAMDLDIEQKIKAITAGDDYELCFTAPTAAEKYITEVSDKLGLPIHCIGEIMIGEGIHFITADGIYLPIKEYGYQHF